MLARLLPGCEEADPGLQLGSGAFESGARVLARGVRDAPVDRLGARELGTDLAHPVTQRYDGVEPPAGELAQVLGPVRGDVDPALAHHLHRVGMQRLRVA